MTDIAIDVRGQARISAPPELGVVFAAVTVDGPEPRPVIDVVTQTVARIRSGMEGLSGVEDFTIDQVRVSAHRPWNDAGVQLPLVHTATVNLTATFADFSVLGEWVTTEGLTVHYVDWRLRPETQSRLERETRQAALSDAVRRAQDYADTLELGPVLVRSVRDPGSEPQPRMMMAAAAAAPTALEFSPEDIEITAEVLAGFTVDA